MSVSVRRGCKCEAVRLHKERGMKHSSVPIIGFLPTD